MQAKRVRCALNKEKCKCNYDYTALKQRYVLYYYNKGIDIYPAAAQQNFVCDGVCACVKLI